MIGYLELHRLGVSAIVDPSATEIVFRRAVSSLYYGLFHRLALEGASAFVQGGPALVAQATRAFDHSSMRTVCQAIVDSRLKAIRPPLDRVMPAPDSRVIGVADAFIRLQAARHRADYDLSSDFPKHTAFELLELAEFAQWQCDLLAGTPEGTVFGTALLLGERWKRRG